MLIHFLQRREPPILPSLQAYSLAVEEKACAGHCLQPQREAEIHQRSRLQVCELFLRGETLRFCTDSGQIQSEMAYLRGDKAPNEDGEAL